MTIEDSTGTGALSSIRINGWRIWRLASVAYRLTTDVTVSDRRPQVTIAEGETIVGWIASTNVIPAATTTNVMHTTFPMVTADGAKYIGGPIPDVWILGDGSLNIRPSGAVAGDLFQFIALTILGELLYPDRTR